MNAPTSNLIAVREAALALARGEALRALGLVGRLEDVASATLRGIAYAQLGDLDLARESLLRARLAASEPLARARIDAALAEIAVTGGDPKAAAELARGAAEELRRLGDVRNAAMQELALARAEILLGRPGAARETVKGVLVTAPSADLRAVASLALAEIAVRELAPSAARSSLADARLALADSPHELLARAIDALEEDLERPVARLYERGVIRDVDLFAIEAAPERALVVDACRRTVVARRATIPLARRPILFALLVVLARAWPDAVARDELAAKAFDARTVNDSHRGRLRVEIGRLRKVLEGIASPVATKEGYVLASERDVVTLLPPSDDEDARVAILLGDGATWSAQAVAEHAGTSKRTAQRALAQLVESGRVVRMGSGKDVRYASAGGRVASRMLLLGLVPTT